ncbi:MAG: hypothetical protein ACFB0C_02710 [Leptolyngbyaceae cyanobacterium]
MKRFLPLLLLLLAGITACSPGDDAASDTDTAPVETAEDVEPAEPEAAEPEGTIVTSTNGTVQLTVPDDWQETDELNDVAILQAANPVDEKYVIVIDDTKEDFADATLEQYAEITSEMFLDILTDPNVSEPVSLTINGNSALQQQVEGSIDNINVIYLQTNVETDTHFYQVLTWTLKSRFDEHESIFKAVTESFQEVGE